MCIILLAIDSHPHFPLILAGNRDEFLERSAAAAHFWPDAPFILAGRDREAGGTWLGVDRAGRWAVVSNIRGKIAEVTPGCQWTTRGSLITDYLQGSLTCEAYVRQVYAKRARYRPFNVLVGHSSCVWHCSSRAAPRALTAGVHGLSNADLDSPWPKVQRGTHALQILLAQPHAVGPIPTQLLQLLSDRTQPTDDELPDTQVGLALERLLAPIFVSGADYGTRCSTVLTIDTVGRVDYIEQSFWQSAPSGRVAARFLIQS